MDHRQELLAWEVLNSLPDITPKQLVVLFDQGSFPSKVLSNMDSLFSDHTTAVEQIKKLIGPLLNSFSVCCFGDGTYPTSLLDAELPQYLFYYQGNIELLKQQSISVIGSRQCTENGLKRARRLARELVQRNVVVVSGLAKGIDTAALSSAIQSSGSVIGVIGTPINQYYPPENKALQEKIAKDHLLISPVPFYRYSIQSQRDQRQWFPRRNAIMSVISAGTVIVEASQKSGTLTQANHCLQQNRPLYILNSCFQSGDTWPNYYERKGAVRVKSIGDIIY